MEAQMVRSSVAFSSRGWEGEVAMQQSWQRQQQIFEENLQKKQMERLPLGQACMLAKEGLTKPTNNAPLYRGGQSSWAVPLGKPTDEQTNQNLNPIRQNTLGQTLMPFGSSSEQIRRQEFQYQPIMVVANPTYIMSPQPQTNMYSIYETRNPQQTNNVLPFQQTNPLANYQQRSNKMISGQLPTGKMFVPMIEHRENLQVPRLRLSQACLQPSFIDNPTPVTANQTFPQTSLVSPATPLGGVSRNQEYNGQKRFEPFPNLNIPNPKFKEPQTIKYSKSHLESLASPIKPRGQSPQPAAHAQASITESGLMMRSENQRYEQQLRANQSNGVGKSLPPLQGNRKRKAQPPPQAPLVTVSNTCKFLGLLDYPLPQVDDHNLSSLASFEAFYLPMLASINPGRGMLRLRTLAKAKWREIRENLDKRRKPNSSFIRKLRGNKVRLNMRI